MKRFKLIILPLVISPFLASCNSSAPSNDYIVTFESNGGTHVETQRVLPGKRVIEPTDPTRSSDIFLGWFTSPTFEEETEFDFYAYKVNSDITLYADWDSRDYARFNFTGENCFVNGAEDFKTNILSSADENFTLTPKEGYKLPKNIAVLKGEREKINYNSDTGIINIKYPSKNIKITAKAEPIASYNFTFNGTDCTVNGDSIYNTTIKQDETVKFTVLPNKNHLLPLDNEIRIIKGSENANYDNGIITITNPTSDIEIEAVAPSDYSPYVVTFKGFNCKANVETSIESAKYDYVANRPNRSEKLVLHLFPDESYELPEEDPIIIFDNQKTTGDYIYDKEGKQLIIFEPSAVTVMLTATGEAHTTHTITLDAGDGMFSTGYKTYDFKIVDNNNITISSFLRSLNLTPTKDDLTFAYYSYADIDNSLIGYTDKIDKDVIVRAHYLPTSELPYSDLNNIDWKIIKGVAVTNKNPSVYFSLGATKAVKLLSSEGVEQANTHNVRIIGYNHDSIYNTSLKTAITFEFTNVICDDNGAQITKYWDRGDAGDDTENRNFPKSTLNTFLNTGNDSVYSSMLPTSLRNNLENVGKTVGRGGGYSVTTYSTKLFPLAYNEIAQVGGGTDAHTEEGSRYDYYMTHTGSSDRIRKDVNGSQKAYWLRSTSKSGKYSVWHIKDNGDIEQKTCGANTYAVAPAFCI